MSEIKTVRNRSGDVYKPSAIRSYDAALQLSARKASSLYGRGIAKLRIGDASGHNDIADAKAIDSRIAEEFARYGVR